MIMNRGNDGQNTGDTDATDWLLSKSTSFSLSDLSSHQSPSSDGDQKPMKGIRANKKKSFKKKEIEMIPPKEKLNKCQRRCKSFRSQDNKERALSELLKLVPLMRLVYGDKHWKYADALGKLAQGYLDLSFGVQAVKSAERARTLILSCDPPLNEDKSSFIICVVEVYLYLGKALLFVGEKLNDAENSLLKSWQVLKSINKQSYIVRIPSSTADDDTDYLKKQIKMALADLYITTKQTDKAILSLQYVVKHIKEKYSEKDEQLILVYSKLAKAEKSRKKSQINYEAVIEHALKAHEISMSCHALSSAEVADTSFALGQAYASINSEGTLTSAETYFNEALSVYRTCLGGNHSKTVKAEDALYKVWMRAGKDEDAIKALKDSIKHKIEGFGECSVQVANTYKLIGGVYLSKGDLVNAHKYLGKCLTIETELYGSQHRKTISTKETIGLVLQNPGFSKSKLSDRPKFSSTIKTTSR